MPKVLQINSVYGIGSTGRLTRDLHHALVRDGFESIVLYGRGPSSQDECVIRVCSDLYGKAQSLASRLTGLSYGGCSLSTATILKIISRAQPDIVHLQCVNEHFVNVYRLVSWLRDNRIRTVLTLHADFMFTANCGSSLGCEGWRDGCRVCPNVKRATKSLLLNRTAESYDRLRIAFDGFGNRLSVVSVSPWLMERAKSSPMLVGFRHSTIMNGIDTSIFRPIYSQDVRQLQLLDGRSIVLHVTSQFDDSQDYLKGGSYVLELARRMINDRVMFVVIGPSRVTSVIPENVVLLGKLSEASELACWYNAASCTLLTSKQETFSLVCAESLCCGTPVVGFRAGGPESIAYRAASTFVSHGDLDALESCVREAIQGKWNRRISVAEQAHSLYGVETMVSRYEEEYRRMLCH